MNKRAIFLLGSAGSGKGFIGKYLTLLEYTVITMSELIDRKMKEDDNFRQAFLEVKNGQGKLLDDNIIIGLLRRHIDDLNSDYLVFDGCTRTVEQTKRVLDMVIERGFKPLFLVLNIPREVAYRRISGRVKEMSQDPNGPRPDDLREDAIKTRLDGYYNNIPLIKKYILETDQTMLHEFDAQQSKIGVIDEINDILQFEKFFSHLETTH